MPPLKKISFAVLALSVFLLNSCSFKDVSYTPSEADEHFLKIAKDELHENPVIKAAGKTLWIYLPSEREIYTLKPSAKPHDTQPPPAFSVQYLDGKFENHIFRVEYDIIKPIKSSKSGSLATGYSEAFGREYSNITSAIIQSYLNANPLPDFIAIVFADIKRGIEIVNTICVEDLKNYQIGSLPYEEYVLRVLNESNGNPDIINDTQGKHLNVAEISWEEFLSKQITNRIAFKFQQSSQPPSGNIEKEILGVIQQSFQNYRFTGYDGVQLKDIRSGVQKDFSPQTVASITQ